MMGGRDRARVHGLQRGRRRRDRLLREVRLRGQPRAGGVEAAPAAEASGGGSRSASGRAAAAIRTRRRGRCARSHTPGTRTIDAGQRLPRHRAGAAHQVAGRGHRRARPADGAGARRPRAARGQAAPDRSASSAWRRADEVLELQGAEAGLRRPRRHRRCRSWPTRRCASGVYVEWRQQARPPSDRDHRRATSAAEFHDLRAAARRRALRRVRRHRCAASASSRSATSSSSAPSTPRHGRHLPRRAGAAEHDIVMGSYGIGLARIAAAAVEQHHDDNGIVWPAQHRAVRRAPGRWSRRATTVQRALAERALRRAARGRLDVLYDDRELSPGVKFKDADLLGCPLQVVVGRGAVNGVVELKERDAVSAAMSLRGCPRTHARTARRRSRRRAGAFGLTTARRSQRRSPDERSP